MAGAVPFAQLVTLTASLCVCAAYRLAAAAHIQRQPLNEEELAEIEKLAIEHGREASLALATTIIDGDREAAIDQGVTVARGLFKKFRIQRLL
jgi:hypothetical protein